MRYHRNAKTNISQRQRIKTSLEKDRVLASKYEVSTVTVAKWKKREDMADRPHTPHTIHYAVPKNFWRIIARVRKHCLFSLDDLVVRLLPYIPDLNRDNCFRILKHYHLNRLSKQEEKVSRKFATYKPGFVHIDTFYLPKILENGQKKRYYCFLAIDRVTRLLFLDIYEHKNDEAAADFLLKCLDFFPFRIHRILTDNGREYTLKSARNRWGKVTVDSLFDIVCQIAGIKHRLTKVKHPWTNGMAERGVRTVKDHTIKVHHYDGIAQMAEGIKTFQDYHNQYRKLKVLTNKSPLEVMIAWFVKEPNLFMKDPTVMYENR